MKEEVAVYYEAYYQLIQSFFSANKDIERETIESILGGYKDTPYQLYGVGKKNGVTIAHFHIYFPKEEYDNESFMHYFSTKVSLNSLEPIEIRSQTI